MGGLGLGLVVHCIALDLSACLPALAVAAGKIMGGALGRHAPPPPPPPQEPLEMAMDLLGQATPALSAAAGLLLASWALPHGVRGYLIAAYFAAAAYSLRDSSAGVEVWGTFCSLEQSAQYSVAVIVLAFAYFVVGLMPGSGGQAGAAAADSEATHGGANASPPKLSYPQNLVWEGSEMKDSFKSMCDVLIDEVIEDLKANYEAIPEQVAWMKEMLDYNVKGGKMNRGIGVIDVQKAFARQGGRKLSNDEYCRAAVLGWCIEWLQAFFLVADDVMDESITRRGQPCWYRVPRVKMIAVNDAFILEALVYKVLRRHFSHEPFYLKLVELFHDVVYRTEMGQLLDLTSQPMDAPADINRFTPQRYKMIVKYKTAFYSFYLPCAIGMIYSGVKQRSSYVLARKICCTIGEYFQIQDDFLDCFGDPEVIGKVGRDIEENKCSWLVVQALSRCTEEQKRLLVENYGKDDPKRVDKVKALYRELQLEEVFNAYEEQSHSEIKDLIAEVTDVPTDVYNFFIKRIYKRSK